MSRTTVISLIVWVLWCVLMEWLALRSKSRRRAKLLAREAIGLVVSFIVAVVLGYFWGD